jgi:hypothetical protein
MFGYSLSVAPALAPCAALGLKIDVGPGPADVIIARKWEGSCPHNHTVEWTDSKRCPNLKLALSSIADLEPPKFIAPGFNYRKANGVLDGAFYEVYAPAFYPKERAIGAAHLSGNVDSPVAAWVRAFAKKLEPCWSKHQPDFG